MTDSSKAPVSALRIMLVEDSAVLASHVTELIEKLPDMWLTGVADNQQDAIKMLADTLPQVLILDLHLRQGNGFGVLRGMARVDPPPKVVVLTTFGLPEYRRQAEKLGVSAFLDKSSDYHLLPGLLSAMAKDLSGGEPAPV
ncbi:MAG: response regulator transcription factor [Steroidobacteraceae bacterium]|jgi:DNA-binding NarL/FixJ family response regulator